MTNVYGMLEVGRTSLLVQQKAMDVTGNNISNVNTPGYSRQRLNMEQNEPIRYHRGQMGTGVRAKRSIQRIHDPFLAAQISNENQGVGRWEAQKKTLEKVELMFDEATGYGLNNAMATFWNSWQDLINNPSGHTERVTLMANSQAMADTFNKVTDDLVQIQQDTDISIQAHVDDINTKVSHIADLNQKIAQVEVDGHSANDYRDERELLLKELSNLIDINHFEDADGYMTVLTGSGKPLVDNVNAWTLTTSPNGVTGFKDVNWVDSSGTPQDITTELSSGQLTGLIEARDNLIPGYLNKVRTLSQTIMTEVNNLHQAGFALDGTDGHDFFNAATTQTMEIDAAVLGDVNLIAAADTAAGVPGDNSNAIAIAQLQTSLTMSGNSATFDDYYNSVVSEVGSDVRSAGIYFDHQTSMLSRMENYREEVSGVNIDEEMIDLVKFQHAYQAAAKVISNVDEMLETLIGMV